MANVLDPDPSSRMRWERKMVIRQVTKRGRLTRAQQLKRTERESLTKSQLFRTSTKKLGMLARQIAGKPIEDAIVQMQFSKKLVAREIKEHLEFARNSAIVRRGLGLGKVEDRTGEPVEIQLKNGQRKTVKDRTSIYIDQAWVNRGKYSRSPEFRARGKMNILHHPHTSISVVLKEEATRVRLSDEAKQKRLSRKLWLHLPDRPIIQQRQYPLW
ncbi:ribosomal protein L22 [Tothia fuscella]|uniref:Ribosomal protein L22 n=1 Tax=Tothia fuscella TaxID=1048955 RepID=A0A9P4U517_9PEZI|nr:ribosomal protein L22 [Tothia fuscella]